MPRGVLGRDHRFSHQGETKHRCAGVLWAAVQLRQTVGPKIIAAPKCPGLGTAAIPARVCSVGHRTVLHGAKRAWVALHGSRTRSPRCFEAAATNLARCRCGRALATGVGWSASRVGREDNHAQVRQHARAPWVVGRFSTGRSARGTRAMGVKRDVDEDLKPQPPTLHRFGEEEPRPMAWGGAQRALAAKITSQGRQRARAPQAVGRFSTGQSARVARHGTQARWPRRFEAAATDLERCRCGRALATGMGWSASRVGRKDNHVKCASTRMLRGPSDGSPWGEARVGRVPRESNAVASTFRSRSRRPVAVSVKKSLGQQRRVERVVRWPQRRPRQVRQRAYTPWAIGRCSTGRSAHGSRCMEVGRGRPMLRSHSHRPGAALVRKSLSHRRGVERVARWPRRQPRPSPSARACSMGRRQVLHRAKRARAARHGARRQWHVVGCSCALAATITTPSPPEHVCSVGGRTVLHGAKRVRVARHGSRIRWL